MKHYCGNGAWAASVVVDPTAPGHGTDVQNPVALISGIREDRKEQAISREPRT